MEFWGIIIGRKTNEFRAVRRLAKRAKEFGGGQMRVRARSTVTITAVALLPALQPAMVAADVDPNRTFSGAQPSPFSTGQVCTGGWCSGRSLFGATQHADCNKAGLGTPAPIDGSRFYTPFLPPDNGLGLPDLRPLFPNAGGDTRQPAARPLYYEPRHSGFTLGTPLEEPRSNYRVPGLRPWSSGEYQKGQHLLFPNPSFNFGLGAFPDASLDFSEPGSNLGPTKGRGGGGPNFGDYLQNFLGSTPRAFGSVNVEAPIGSLPDSLGPFGVQEVSFQQTTYSTLMYPESYTGDVMISLRILALPFEINGCRVVLVPDDPNFRRTSRNGGNSWGGKLDDQWAIKRVGFTGDESSAWGLVDDSTAEVIVAVIDTGLDWHHLDIAPKSIWRNSREIEDNGIDDDQNGYVDDVIGWNFLARNNRPWDFDGHGTVVAGIIAAAQNDVGIAGINPDAKIMVLKAVNNFGTTRASFLAEAIVYAVDNGARIINISVGGAVRSRMEQAAIDYAQQAGVLVVAAAGNEGIELDDYGPGGGENVLTIGATHTDDRGASFSNFGDRVDLAAPGVDVLSLRARFTDANYRPNVESGNAETYVLGANYVGDDKRYLRVSGTSFSTPIVAGVASLLFGKNPELSSDDVARILKETATDVDIAGVDKYTGHGIVDARAALGTGADFSITAEITGVQPVPADAPAALQVQGTIDADSFKRAWMQIGPGDNPAQWRYVGAKRKYPIVDGTLGTIPLSRFAGADTWQIVVNVEHKNGVVRRDAYTFRLN